ncbi:unnamed protein product [Schistocephalus solidus]|uniref:Uncharacterized protein n=1 Tax=Schistocephalus solidus TaxID=70667 RepID=A0A183TAI6_SCHSO|nr:unnamed protein product [Schistocephalus solidus]
MRVRRVRPSRIVDQSLIGRSSVPSGVDSFLLTSDLAAVLPKQATRTACFPVLVCVSLRFVSFAFPGALRNIILMGKRLKATKPANEARFSEQVYLEEVRTGYAIFWSGHPKAERRDASVTFAIRNDIVGRLPCLLQGINDCLINLRLPLRRDKFATIITASEHPLTRQQTNSSRIYMPSW